MPSSVTTVDTSRVNEDARDSWHHADMARIDYGIPPGELDNPVRHARPAYILRIDGRWSRGIQASPVSAPEALFELAAELVNQKLSTVAVETFYPEAIGCQSGELRVTDADVQAARNLLRSAAILQRHFGILL